MKIRIDKDIVEIIPEHASEAAELEALWIKITMNTRCWGAKLFGAAANAISIPPGEYVRKNETQRN